MIVHIGTVAVYVDDQQKALQFWTEKAGFEVYRNDPMGPNASWIEVGPKDTRSHLVIYPKSMMKNANELKASIVFVTENMTDTYETMKKMVWNLHKSQMKCHGVHLPFLKITKVMSLF